MSFSKVVRLGQIEGHSVFCKIEYKEENGKGHLSITGVVGPKGNGNAWGSCGQIVEDLAQVDAFAPGWDQEKVQKFIAIWNKWHLNDMRAGCEHQKGRSQSGTSPRKTRSSPQSRGCRPKRAVWLSSETVGPLT
jgi:hypothetical protein